MKVLPNDVYSEKLLLALVLQNPRQIGMVIDQINTKDLFDANHQKIYEAMIALNKKSSPVTLATMIQELTKTKLLNIVGGIEFLEELNTIVISEAELPTIINTIKEAAIKRMVYSLSDDLSNRSLVSNTESNDLIEYAEEKLYQIARRKSTTEFIHISEIAREYKTTTETLHKSGGKINGLDPGYSNISDLVPGFKPEQFIILAARTGVGKSAFALNLAYKIATQTGKQKKKIAFFSLEMSNEQLVSRLISMVGNIDLSKLQNTNLSASDWKNFYVAVDTLSNVDILFDDASSSNIGDIRAKCRKLKEQDNLDFIIIDYLQLINLETKTGMSRQEVVSRISRSLKELARELKIPILALSQLSRNVANHEDQKPEISDLRESGSLEQDADIILLIYKPKAKGYEQFGDYENLEIEVAKNRQGRTGLCHFLFEKKYVRFSVRVDSMGYEQGDISEAN